MRQLRSRWLGRLPYAESWDLQKAFWESIVQGRSDDDHLLLVEHPHTYTLGRNGDGSNLLATPEQLVGLGAEYFEIDRGGDITYHGPGQLVGYPIMMLDDPKRIVPFVRKIEQALISVLADLDVEAWAEDGYTGVWTEGGKVAAIGLRVSRGVSMHGFALNVNPDLSFFGHMNPCGIADRPVTSLTELLNRPVVLEEVTEAVAAAISEAFEYDSHEPQFAAFNRGQGRSRPFAVDALVTSGTFSPEARTAEPILIGGRLPGEPERPEWMRVKVNMGSNYLELKRLMRDLELNTVCEEAGCPNIYECWGQGTATVMILGDLCTRSCSFCDVKTGKPQGLDLMEPYRVAEAVASMGLQYAVITSVDRDDLSDGGSGVFAATIREVRKLSPDCAVEVLIPDFKGDADSLATLLAAEPEVLNHNTETVLRLQRDVRTAANYGRSLALLARARWTNPNAVTKSGLIVGMGETKDEILGALTDLNAVGVSIVTIGQYLRPTPRHAQIARYVHPDEFAEYKAFGEALGISTVESGPLVRSSYHAKDSMTKAGGIQPSRGVPVTIGGRHS